jgi:hypothetical protein
LAGMDFRTPRHERREIMAKARCDGRAAFATSAEAGENDRPFFCCRVCGKYHRCLPLDALTIATALAYADRLTE